MLQCGQEHGRLRAQVKEATAIDQQHLLSHAQGLKHAALLRSRLWMMLAWLEEVSAMEADAWLQQHQICVGGPLLGGKLNHLVKAKHLMS